MIVTGAGLSTTAGLVVTAGVAAVKVPKRAATITVRVEKIFILKNVNM